MGKDYSRFLSAEELRGEGYVPQVEAEKALGLPAGEMISWDYIDAEQNGADGRNWVKLLPKYRGLVKTENGKRKPDTNVKCKVSDAKCKMGTAEPAPRRRRSDWELLEKYRPGFFGIGVYTVREAAGELALTVNYVQRIAHSHLNAIKRDGRVWIPKNEVELYRWKQERWAALGGQWTAYGRQPKLEFYGNQRRLRPEGFRRPATDDGRPDSGIANCKLTIDNCQLPEEWVRVDKVAEILNLSEVQAHRYGASGRIRRKVVREGSGFKKAYYLLEDVLRVEEEREAGRKTIPVSQWKHDLRHPYIRTKIEAAPGDRLVSRREAAFMLGCSEPRVSILVAEGFLFGWQTSPGKPGCRLWLSENQILRFGSTEDRVMRKERWERGRAGVQAFRRSGVRERTNTRTSSRTKTTEEVPEWKEWRFENGIEMEPGTDQKDHGEYYSTAQAARVLKVSSTAVGKLRKRGRLNGFRHPWKVGRYEHRRWWFYKKEEVHALAEDFTYRRLRDRGKECHWK